ncbi:uncharacterized protein LOC124282236 [Haliotis rubra]|uniref:uncharacterized protein LOC124282236 n=1 Tax=Haliotis rubra TaxID=36100 RepID=UPI001EE5082F|nr:uncharacterized protein LOC124282236 [Haliotis rubra]
MFIDICYRISANSGVKRLTKDVKKKWMDYKSQTRKKEAERRREATKTGGGPPPSSLTEMEQRVVSFLPSCTIQGCDGGLESEEFEFHAVDTVDAVAHLMASKTLSDKDTIVMIEREKLNVLKDLLEVQKKRLHIEEQKFAYITSLHQTGQSELNVSPIIQFL